MCLSLGAAAGCDGTEGKLPSPGAHASGWGLGSSLLALPCTLWSVVLGYWHACLLFMELGAGSLLQRWDGDLEWRGGMVAVLWVRSRALLSAKNACMSECLVCCGPWQVPLPPAADPSSDPQAIRKWLSNLLPQCSHRSKNMNQNLAGMNDVCRENYKRPIFPCPIKHSI